MDVGKLKDKEIIVQYLIPNTSPKRGFKRMQYFTSFSEEPDIFYIGISIRKSAPYKKSDLERWVNQGQLKKLSEPIILPYEKDIWLNERGEVVLALGYAPWEDEDIRVIGDKDYEGNKISF